MKMILASLFAFGTLFATAQSKEGDFHLDKEYKISPTGVVKLNCSDAKVFVTGTVRTSAHLKVDREVVAKGLYFGHDEFSVNVTEEEGNLSIKENSHHTMMGIVGYYSEKYTIVLEVPEGASLTVRGDDGDYVVKNLNGAISLTLDDADVQLTACKGNDFQFRLDDGDITMDQGRGSLEIDGDDTDILIRNAAFQKIIANIDDGDFVVETSLTENGNYRIDAQDGLVSLNILGGGGKFDIRHDDARVTASEKFEMSEESESYTRLTLGSGGAQVIIHADDARVKLSSR